MEKFYITTTLPYVNAEPHIGFALEIVQADAIARFHQELLGREVFFNFGTDEHGLKIYRKALEAGKDPKVYCDEYAAKFDDLKLALNLSYNHFIRTTDPHHEAAAREFWKLCAGNGYIDKQNHKIKYCVGCELEKTESELTDGRCPLHPNLEIETYEEENYFFKFSQFQKPLLGFYDAHPDFVIPAEKFSEIKTFVKNGLQDFSISRLKSKMPWGVPVPGDPEHVMYVWFDALVNYISTLGWPEDQKIFSEFWPGIQIAGKDNLRQQTAIWQAMLLAAGLPNSKQVYIHGFITANGQKISKSLGNVVNPFDLVKKYGTDAVRYYLLAKINPYEDSDFTYEKFEEAYNADLANGLGNLVSRIAKLAEKSGYSTPPAKTTVYPEITEALNLYRFDQALGAIWNKVTEINGLIDRAEPWKLTGADLEDFLGRTIPEIQSLAFNLSPYLPGTAGKIAGQFSGKVTSSAPLFPRIV